MVKNMKSVLLVYENAADVPRDELDGRTPLQVARCPAAARLATDGCCGLLKSPGGEPGRVEAMLAALSGVPREDAWRLARGPLEAEAMKVDWAAYSYAYRGDFVTLDEGVLRDSWLSKLSLQETELLAQAVQAEFDPAEARLLTLDPGHVIVLLKSDDTRLDPGRAPWTVEGEVEATLPTGRHGKLLREVMDKAAAVLAKQTINDVRVDLGENPATALWLWGGGPRQDLLQKFGGRPVRAAMLTQSAFAAGLGRLLGMTVEPLLDPWAGHGPADVLDGSRLASLLRDHDWLVVYVEAPRALLAGPPAEKVRLLERMDLLLTQPLLEGLKKVKHRRALLATLDTVTSEADRARPLPRPFALWGAHVEPDAVMRWDEPSCGQGGLGQAEPGRLVDLLAGESTWR